MSETSTKAPVHLWVVGLVALLFNGYGAYDYLMTKMQGRAYMEGAGMSGDHIAMVEAMPMWMNVVWPVGVWGAVLASLLLLLRKRLAFPVFAVSLAAFLISLVYNYGMNDGMGILGTTGLVMSAVIAAVLLFLTLYSRTMSRKGVLG